MFARSAHTSLATLPPSLASATSTIAPFPKFSYTPPNMPRIISNKENTFTVRSKLSVIPESPSTAAPGKPRVNGMGRPKPSLSRRHCASYKTGVRTASIKRAKIKANRTRLSRKRAEAEGLQMEDVRMDWGVEEPPTVAGSSVLCLPFHAIPLRSTRPAIPPVTHTTEDGTKIPVDFVLKYLLPFLPDMYDTCTLYQPAVPLFKSVEARQNPPTYPFGLRLDDAFEAVPYWVSEAIHHGGLNPSGQARCKSRGPNALLLVRKMGDVDTMGVAYPIHKTVFSTRCSHFSTLVSHGRSLRSPSETSTSAVRAETKATVATPSSPARTRYSTTVPKSNIRSTRASSPPRSSRGNTPTEAKEVEESGHPFYRYSTRFEGDKIPRPVENANTAYGVRQLPILPVYLPDPTTFDLILRHLHFPTQSLLSLFFDSDSKDLPSQIVDLRKRLVTCPSAEILRIAGKLQGFYANAEALGISSTATWNQWALAQVLVRDALRARGAWLDTTKTFILVPKQHGQGLPPLVMVPCQEPTPVRVRGKV